MSDTVAEVTEETRPLGSLRAQVDEEEPSSLVARSGPVHARHHPWAVGLVWLYELVAASIIATPVHGWARAMWGAHPDGDAVLFRPGGRALLAWLLDDGPALPMVVRTTLALLLLFTVLGQVVTGGLIAALSTRLSVSSALRVGVRAFSSLVILGALAAALQTFFVGSGFFLSETVDTSLRRSTSDSAAHLWSIVVLGVFVVFALVIGVVADLARVALVRGLALEEDGDRVLREHLRDAILSAARTARRSLGRATLAWGVRAAISVSLIWIGAVASDTLPSLTLALFAIHQLVLLARAGLRASWLAYALRLVR